MDGQKKKGGRLKRKGAEERENFIREEVRGLDGEGKIRDEGENHATHRLSKAVWGLCLKPR